MTAFVGQRDYGTRIVAGTGLFGVAASLYWQADDPVAGTSCQKCVHIGSMDAKLYAVDDEVVAFSVPD
jgi:hypothetical protein